MVDIFVNFQVYLSNLQKIIKLLCHWTELNCRYLTGNSCCFFQSTTHTETWIHFSPSTCLWMLLAGTIGNIRVLKDYKQIWLLPQAIPLELIMLPCKVYNLQEAGLLRRQASLWKVFHTSYNRQLRHFQVF